MSQYNITVLHEPQPSSSRSNHEQRFILSTIHQTHTHIYMSVNTPKHISMYITHSLGAITCTNIVVRTRGKFSVKKGFCSNNRHPYGNQIGKHCVEFKGLPQRLVESGLTQLLEIIQFYGLDLYVSHTYIYI